MNRQELREAIAIRLYPHMTVAESKGLGFNPVHHETSELLAKATVRKAELLATQLLKARQKNK